MAKKKKEMNVATLKEVKLFLKQLSDLLSALQLVDVIHDTFYRYYDEKILNENVFLSGHSAIKESLERLLVSCIEKNDRMLYATMEICGKG